MPAETPSSPPSLAALVDRVCRGHDLSVAEAEVAFDHVMSGEAPEALVGALLAALRTKGHAPTEVAGGVRALRAAMVPVEADQPDGLVDTAGTGGGALTTFNISTAGALVAAGAGVRVAKHGNRSFTSRSGSADVLEALGVRIDLTPQAMSRVLHEAGIVFMFAPLLHPAMRHVGPVRRALGFPTLMNLLGPLTNPAGARRQVVGVSDPALLPLVVDGLRELGHNRALVVHGAPGMDEVSPVGPTTVAELREGEVRTYEVTPGELGVDPVDPTSLAGGEPSENARVVEAVLRGEERGGPRAAVVVNAAAALLVADAADSLAQGVTLAAETIDSGAAMDALERLRRASARAVEGA
ncbi:MAG: anthranilate phosphoribosyltransferase [Gemmatimonadetes bacterium]|nr:MAG: anthranilate phosphoribosyltransferase [Gemmatimonadota bacterium]